jgi:hypothetical protein
MRYDTIFRRQQAEQLGERGYVESAAYPDWFSKSLANIRARYPEAEFVDAVGADCNQQIIFLPRRKQEIQARLMRDLEKFEAAAASTRKALASLKA